MTNSELRIGRLLERKPRCLVGKQQPEELGALAWEEGTTFFEYVNRVNECIDREQRYPTRIENSLGQHVERLQRALDRLWRDRGKRYSACGFDNYEILHSHQREVVEKLQTYGRASRSEIASGTGVLLFGPRGTGKDHLLMALAAKCARWSGRAVRWVNGNELFEDFKRVAMGEPSQIDQGDRSSSLVNCDVLWISDPLPPSGALSEFQQSALFRLIDKRYSDLKPVWVTLNVENAIEAETRMGGQVVDRLRHGAVTCRCHWPSFREA